MKPTIQSIVEEIFRLYDVHGMAEYIGEPVSQVEHMCQAAQLAEKEGHDEEVVLAAFFHDFGHICATGSAAQMDGYGTRNHEKIGADYLRRAGFSEKTAQLVESHVQAKRYLTFKHPDYFNLLSEASRRTLEFQGGRMNEKEASAFEQDPLFALYLRMRNWDERAKEESMPLPDLDKYKKMALNHLGSQPSAQPGIAPR